MYLKVMEVDIESLQSAFDQMYSFASAQNWDQAMYANGETLQYVGKLQENLRLLRHAIQKEKTK